MFDCENRTPTAYYPLDEAVEEGCLVRYEVYTHTTRFLRKGIKYKDLTAVITNDPTQRPGILAQTRTGIASGR